MRAHVSRAFVTTVADAQRVVSADVLKKVKKHAVDAVGK